MIKNRMMLNAGLLAAGLLFAASSARATVLYNESANPDLSNNQASPTPFTLAVGSNSVIGSVGTGDTQDWIALTVTPGLKISSIVLAGYQSAHAQGFTGFQNGASFIGSPFSASSYAGYAHYGTGATNGPLPPTNLVGADLLPIMANPSLAAGSQGFTPPLLGGTYAFLIQQLGSSTSYQFDFNVQSVPEPASLGILAIGLVVLFPTIRWKLRRWRT